MGSTAQGGNRPPRAFLLEKPTGQIHGDIHDGRSKVLPHLLHGQFEEVGMGRVRFSLSAKRLDRLRQGFVDESVHLPDPTQGRGRCFSAVRRSRGMTSW